MCAFVWGEGQPKPKFVCLLIKPTHFLIISSSSWNGLPNIPITYFYKVYVGHVTYEACYGTKLVFKCTILKIFMVSCLHVVEVWSMLQNCFLCTYCIAINFRFVYMSSRFKFLVDLYASKLFSEIILKHPPTLSNHDTFFFNLF